MLKVSPIADFLRANHAKAKNFNSYTSYQPYFNFVKSCEFYDPKGKYLGEMKRIIITPYEKTGSSYLSQNVYIKTLEDNFRVCREEQMKQFGTFAKIKGQNGENDMFVPEKLTKEFSFRDKNGNIIKDTWERVISSKLKPLPKEPNKEFNVYEALEPLKYNETHLGKTVETPKH